ncbi:MBL fold metallo-hydrolase [Candidatus Woesebacteria bacterium]|nr:MBL fold metallo-hydrolase [Candidatus Woesebacteria bacterium]
MVDILFLGAAGTVTGSSYLVIPENGKSLLIDCGMFQGSHAIDALNNRPITIDPATVAGVILTHAHLDHCGRLPMLYSAGFRVPIYMTEATRALTELSLLDSAKVGAERDTALYTIDDVLHQIPYFTNVEYHRPFQVGNFTITMKDAGHILGSASLEVVYTSPAGKKETIIFSGDLGNTPQDIIKPTEYFDRGDTIIMESTYGDRIHPDEDPVAVLAHEIQAIEDNQATLLIPSFSLERTQELLHKIDHLKRDKKVKNETKVYLDSPMAERATEIFKQYRKLYNQELSNHVSHDDPFSFPGLVTVEKGHDSAKIKEQSGAKVIIAGSGMMTGGRILNHAIDFLPRHDTRILFVGYQAEATIGRAIMTGEKSVTIYGQHVEVNASIADTQALSSHADQPRLLNWLSKIDGAKKIILTHGEDGPRETLKSEIQKKRQSEVFTPRLDEVIRT